LAAWERWKKDNWQTEPIGADRTFGKTTATQVTFHEGTASASNPQAKSENAGSSQQVGQSESASQFTANSPRSSAGNLAEDQLSAVSELQDGLTELDKLIQIMLRGENIGLGADADILNTIKDTVAQTWQTVYFLLYSENSPVRPNGALQEELNYHLDELAAVYESALTALSIYTAMQDSYDYSRSGSQDIERMQRDLHALAEERRGSIAAVRHFYDTLSRTLVILPSASSQPSKRPSHDTGAEAG
jgi:hypothetical protein